MVIALACDHGGYPLKAEVLKYLFAHNHEVIDLGTDSATQSVDYPDYAKKAGEAVLDGRAERGILLCGTGIGMSIAANKISGVRCALLSDVYSARLTREHNDANMMAMGARVVGPGLALDIIGAFLSTEFSKDDRHQRRIDKVAAIEKEIEERVEKQVRAQMPQVK